MSEFSPTLGGDQPDPTELANLITNAKAGDPMSKLCIAALYYGFTNCHNPDWTLYDLHKHCLRIQSRTAKSVNL